MTQTNTTQNKEELNKFYKKHQHYFQDPLNENLTQDDFDVMIKNIEDLLSQAHQSGIEEERKRTEEAELIGAAKILDELWNNSYYTMGEEGSNKIRETMEYYFGKNWNVDMYKFARFNHFLPRTLKTLEEIIESLKENNDR